MPKTCAVCGSKPTHRVVGKKEYCGKKECTKEAFAEAQRVGQKH